MNDIDESKFQVVDASSANQHKPEKAKVEANEFFDKPTMMSEVEDATFELPHNKNVDVFNALNLYNEELGFLYESEGYNPLGENFILTEDFAQSVLLNKGNENCNIEEFLEHSNSQIAKTFTSAMEKNDQLIDKFNKEISLQSDSQTKEEMKKMVISLKNRSQLLKLNIQKLKNKDANAIKMYKELFGQDSELSKLLKEEFEDKLNIEMVIQKMIGLSMARIQTAKAKLSKSASKNKDLVTELKNEVQQDVSKQTENIANQNAEQEQQAEQKQQEEQAKPEQEHNTQDTELSY